MTDQELGNESSEPTESATTSSESAPEVQTQSVETGQEVQPSTEKQDVPFHEHPRFKELVEQKNQFAAESKQLKEAYARMQDQFAQLQNQYKQPAPQKPSYDPLFKEIEQVNPQFAQLIKEQWDKAGKVDQLEQRLAQQEQFYESYQAQQAQGNFDKLCSEYKVDPAFKDFYRESVANMANATRAKFDELPALFKQAHERISKTIEDYKREITKSYVTDKSKDKAPISQTGGTPVKATPSKDPISRDDVKRQFAQAIRNRNNI